MAESLLAGVAEPFSLTLLTLRLLLSEDDTTAPGGDVGRWLPNRAKPLVALNAPKPPPGTERTFMAGISAFGVGPGDAGSPNGDGEPEWLL